jgi:2-dehydro-3-deoxygluconokinase
MTERKWLNRTVVGIGEAMVEFAPVGDNLYRRGFAGDTLNTCWHIAKIVRDQGLHGEPSGDCDGLYRPRSQA